MEVVKLLGFVLGSIALLSVLNYFLIRDFINGRQSFVAHHILLVIPILILLYLITGKGWGEAFIGIILFLFVISYEMLLFLQLAFFRRKIKQRYYPTSAYFLLFLLSAGAAVVLFGFLINGQTFKIGG